MSTTAYQIIAVDFDGTLCYSNWPELGEPNRPLIEYLINQKRSGNAASDAETRYLCSNESNLLKSRYPKSMETGYYEKSGPVIHKTNFFCG